MDVRGDELLFALVVFLFLDGFYLLGRLFLGYSCGATATCLDLWWWTESGQFMLLLMQQLSLPASCTHISGLFSLGSRLIALSHVLVGLLVAVAHILPGRSQHASNLTCTVVDSPMSDKVLHYPCLLMDSPKLALGLSLRTLSRASWLKNMYALQ